MIRRTLMALLVAATVFGAAGSPRALRAQDAAASHVGWVAETLEHMQTVKVGMTRKDLLAVFTTEGGLSTGLSRTFVSRACPYFKVDVEFEAVGRPNRDREGRVTLVEDPRDVIVKCSRPYLEFAVMD